MYIYRTAFDFQANDKSPKSLNLVNNTMKNNKPIPHSKGFFYSSTTVNTFLLYMDLYSFFTLLESDNGKRESDNMSYERDLKCQTHFI